MVDQSRTLTQFILAMLATCLLLTGCQQPVSNGQARAGGPFGLGTPRLFANNNQARPNNGLFAGLTGAGNNSNAPGFGGFSGNNVFGFGQNENPNPVQYPNSPINPFQNNQQVNPQNVASQFNQLNQQFNQRLTAYDTDNQLLNTELASLKQKLELSNQYGQTLKQQLADSATRAQQAEAARLAATQQLGQAQSKIEQLNQALAANNARPTNTQQAGFGGNGAPTRLPGATLNANNSLARRISDLEAIGLQPRLDGDVIRIEFPTDQFLVPSEMRILPNQLPVLQNVVGTIRRSFPKQIIGIEAHWDNSPVNPATLSHHELTARQSLAVLDRLVAMGLPANQLFAMAMGSNRPRYQPQRAGGISPNRRIELVIYPETYDRR